MRIQLRGYSKLKVNTKDREMIIMIFYLGPVRICVNANIPDEGRSSAPYYVQVEMTLKDKDWTEVVALSSADEK